MAPLGPGRTARIAGGAADRDRLAALRRGATGRSEDDLLPHRHGVEGRYSARRRGQHRAAARVRRAAGGADRLEGDPRGHGRDIPRPRRPNVVPPIREGNDLATPARTCEAPRLRRKVGACQGAMVPSFIPPPPSRGPRTPRRPTAERVAGYFGPGRIHPGFIAL